MNINDCACLSLKDPLIFITTFFLIAYSSIGIFLAYRRLNAMELLLNKCRLIEFHQPFWGNSIRGRMLRLWTVYTAIAFPKRNARRGIVDAEQVRMFPKGTKYLLHCTGFFGTGGLLGSIVFIFCYQQKL
ncbi:hypothetical protein [Pseudomonas cedrina]|uniref:hypothetical protein n=1 Tax=Pseudomonas cedrina TaxID=651740 RepID=UPI0027826784|nr:hypothetical protein [Pseudomonas cedrina]MDQ0651099.1 hypothetical protein [Pseudomonas cedrina]